MRDLLHAVLLLLITSVPLLTTSWSSDAASTHENRRLAPFPSPPSDLATFNTFPTKLDAWFKDHFGFRLEFVHLYKLAALRLQDSTSRNVTIGKSGWLFLGQDLVNYPNYNDPLADVSGRSRYKPDGLHDVVRFHKAVQQYLKKKHGTEYLVLLLPNKSTVYSQYLPAYITPSQDHRPIDELATALKNAGISVINMKHELLQASKTEEIYTRYDTHWNAEGVELGARRLSEFLKTHFPGIPIRNPKYEQVPKLRLGDLGAMLGLEYHEQTWEPRFECQLTVEPYAARHLEDFRAKQLTCGEPVSPVLLIGDSFLRVNRFNYYAAYMFGQAIDIYMQSSKRYYFPDRLLTTMSSQTRPKLVIHEAVERNLPCTTKIAWDRSGRLYCEQLQASIPVYERLADSLPDSSD